MNQSAGISPSFAASSAAGKDRTQSALTQHEMYIRRKAVRVLQEAHLNNVELLWIIASDSAKLYNNRFVNWSTKEILQPRDILPPFRPPVAVFVLVSCVEIQRRWGVSCRLRARMIWT